MFLAYLNLKKKLISFDDHYTFQGVSDGEKVTIHEKFHCECYFNKKM